ncbi:fimbrial protein [Acinetobacter equi]|uniref:Fimbrial-type adhesion domain-containing protein n=1 Tax=Acinetobacter equi TaxID=1324350 RepID=A0A0N9WDX0_9GAMM|nr:fimbrial protein [Acinetobacter equi]ALH95498.1 hypothetical protein AOY20_08150 [Acinetobacter equi]
MKKLQRMKSISLLSCGISLALGLCLSSTTQANDRVINVVGLLVAKPCEIINTEIDVNFDAVNTPQLMSDSAPTKDFQIRLNNCPSSNIRTKFVGEGVDNNQLLGLSTGSTAQGVGIRLYDEQNRVIPIGQDTVGVSGVPGVVHVLNFHAQVAKLSDATTADLVSGAFTATATYEVSYD